MEGRGLSKNGSACLPIYHKIDLISTLKRRVAALQFLHLRKAAPGQCTKNHFSFPGDSPAEFIERHPASSSACASSGTGRNVISILDSCSRLQACRDRFCRQVQERESVTLAFVWTIAILLSFQLNDKAFSRWGHREGRPAMILRARESKQRRWRIQGRPKGH